MIKQGLRKIDAIFLNKAIQRLRAKRLLADRTSQLRRSLDHRFAIYYQKDNHDLLSQLCDKYGSDKGEIKNSGHPYGWPSCTYADFYSRLFSHCRNSVQRVFECGIGTNNPNLPSSMGPNGMPGASLRVWRDYFPNASVIGADIDRSILFEEERIRTFYIDQLDPIAISKFWREIGLSDFDFMVDDGLHTFEAGICLFENSISKLARHGIYIIEDIDMENLLRYREFFGARNYVVDYVSLHQPNIDVDLDAYCLVAIRHPQIRVRE